MQKTARKNTKHWRNVTILKMGDFAKAIAHSETIYCKMVGLGQKLKVEGDDWDECMLWFKFSFGAKFLKLVQLLFSFVMYSLP